jgi:hypothetical protein
VTSQKPEQSFAKGCESYAGSCLQSSEALPNMPLRGA